MRLIGSYLKYVIKLSCGAAIGATRERSVMTIGQRIDERMRIWANPSWWNLFVVLPWAIGAIVFIHEWKVDREVAMREQTTRGFVTTHEPSNHNRYGYVFSVNGKSFTGWESPQKEELEVGRQVVVYYDPQDPNKNALTEFRDLGMTVLGPVPPMLFGIGAVAWYIGHRRRRIRLSQTPPHSHPD
jgi:hypothetical protein